VSKEGSGVNIKNIYKRIEAERSPNLVNDLNLQIQWLSEFQTGKLFITST
jgi:hypothetical protein